MTPEAFKARLDAMSTFSAFEALLDDLTQMGITDKAHTFRKQATAKARAELVTEENHWLVIWSEERDNEGDLQRALMQAETHDDFSSVYHDARESEGEVSLDIQRRALLGMIQRAEKLSHLTNILKEHRLTMETPLDSLEPHQQELLRVVCQKLWSFCGDRAA